MPTLHLIAGPVGGGKTTLALALVKQTRGVHFSIDEWMATLFMPDAPQPITYPWAIERVHRCEAAMIKLWPRLFALDIHVIADLGFYRRAHRDRIRAIGRELGVDVRTHLADAPLEVRRERVRERNRGSATFTVEVSDQMFDAGNAMWEPLGDDER